MLELQVRFCETDHRIGAELDGGSDRFDAELAVLQQIALLPDPYMGAYEVTPAVEAQTLPTKQKTMQNDLTVKSIPYYEMDNQNGTTVYIGSEV